MNDELREINAKARKLLEYLHWWAIKAGGRPFSISPHDPDTAAKTGLDGENYMSAAGWLIRKHLAKWMGSGGMLTITDYGIQVAGDAGSLDYALPAERVERGVRNETDEGDETMTGPSIFISHASVDKKLAKNLIDLIEAGISVPTGGIRCTSVPGYQLDGGDVTPEVLRNNLKACSVVLGVLTTTSISSSYVQMELGAAWAFKKRAIPLIGPGATFDNLPGPFKNVIHALKMENQADMSGLIKTLARETGLPETNNMPKVVAALNALNEAITASGAPGVSPPAPFRA